MPSMIRKFGAFLILVTALCSVRLLGQTTPTGTISGVVHDPSGLVVPKASVTVRNVEENTTRTALSGDDGSFRFPALPVGTYTITVESTGFKTSTRTNQNLDVSQEAVLNFTMEIGEAQEQVVVKADAAQVDTTSSTIGHVVDEQQLAELPLNGRNFVDLTLLQTGVNQYTNNQYGSGGLYGEFYSANGAPIRSNMYTLDGAIEGNVQGATASSLAGESLGLDGISEYRLMTNTFGAEYGLVMGSQTVIVTKSGTNQFHGDAFEYIRNAVLNARNYFDQLYSLPTTVPDGGKRIAPFERNQFGGAVGGPIAKDKLFFFGTYEGFRQIQDNPPQVGNTPTIPASCHTPVVNGVETVDSTCDSSLKPGQTENVNPYIQPILALWPNPNTPGNLYTYLSHQTIREDYAQGRVDHTISAADSMFGRYTYDGTNMVDPRIFAFFDTGLVEQQHYFTLGENHVFNAKLLNSGQFSFSRSNIVDTTPSSSNPYTAQLTGPKYSCVTGEPICTFNVSSIANFSDTGAQAILETQDIFSVGDDLFWTKGKHAMKFGMLFNHFEQYADLAHGQKGMTNWSSLQSFLLGKYRNYTVYAPGYNGLKDMLFATVGFYATDEYRATRRLTLNYGLRYEFDTQPNEKNGRQSYFAAPPYSDTVSQGQMVLNPTYTDFSPRVGFALDVFGDGKTSLRGGAAILYDLANNGAIFGLAGESLPPYSLAFTVTPCTAWTNPAGPAPASCAAGTGPATITLPLYIPPVTGSLQGTAPTAIDRNWRTPRMVDMNLAVERQLPFSTILSVAYAGSRGTHLWQPADEVNPNCPTSYKYVPNGCAGYTTGVSTLPIWGGGTPRLNPFYSNFNLFMTRGVSWYNSLQVNLTKSLTHGLQYQLAYTYSRLLDDTEGIANTDTSGGTTDTVEDPYDPIIDWGPSNFDITHNFHNNVLYHLPQFRDSAFASKFTNGWWMGSIVNWHTGTPFSATEQADREGSGIATSGGGTERVAVVTAANIGALTAAAQAAGITTCPAGSTSCYTYNPVIYNKSTVMTKNVNQWFNPNMFALAPAGTIGNSGRNILREPGLVTWDISLNKDTALRKLGERGQVQFRAEFFNVLNHTNFGPSHVGGLFAGTATDTVERPTFTGISSTATPGRQIQFSLRAAF